MSRPAAGGGAEFGAAIGRWTRRVLVAVVAAVMFAMMALTTADVAGRFLIAAPIPGAFEIVTFLLAILVFAALPLVTWDEKHITVALFERWTAGWLRRGLDIGMSLISTAVLGAVTHRMWIQADLMAEGQHVTGFLEWPIAPVAYFMSLLSGLTTVILAVITLRKLGAGGAAPRPDRVEGL